MHLGADPGKDADGWLWRALSSANSAACSCTMCHNSSIVGVVLAFIASIASSKHQECDQHTPKWLSWQVIGILKPWSINN
jgi:hypothetical protein